MSIDVRASGDDLELWHVEVGGAVRTMTLDELDAAFQAGAIDERTRVLRAGSLGWTTLGDAAGIEEQPNSLAPMATDLASSNVLIPPPPAVDLDLPLATAELAVFRPRRRVGRVVAAFAAVGVLAAGALGVSQYGADALGAKIATVTALAKGAGDDAARSAATAPPAAEEPPGEAPATAASVEVTTPVSKPAPAPQAADVGVSVDSLPTATTPPAKGKKATKSTKRGAKKRRPSARSKKAHGKSSSDPTQRGGAAAFDPLNGDL